MNIKNVWNSLVNLAGVSNQKLDKKAKLEASDEKDTQLGHGDEEASQHQMSEEEANQAVEIFKNLDGVKENNLSVRLEFHNDRYIVYVEDPNGKVIRRIPENELWFALKKHRNQISKDSNKGSLLNKTG